MDSPNDTRTEWEFATERFMTDIRAAFFGGTSLRTMAEQIGVSASTLSRLDNGARPDMESLLTICAYCDLIPGDYFEKYVWQRVRADTPPDAGGA